jgi:hypothetical protein
MKNNLNFLSKGKDSDEIWKIGKEQVLSTISPNYEIKDELLEFLLTEAALFQ